MRQPPPGLKGIIITKVERRSARARQQELIDHVRCLEAHNAALEAEVRLLEYKLKLALRETANDRASFVKQHEA